MDLEQAHTYLDNAEHSIRHFFMMDEELEVICDLLQRAKTAKTLKVALARTRIAGIALLGAISDCDERTIASEYIKEALAEFQYHSRPRMKRPQKVACAEMRV